ncbi:MAG TPA: NAD(+) synthase [Candidatus Acidoferrales bacterium]|nr:NAD(+) synthase [Candidatus Acidoferrales bacterium]
MSMATTAFSADVLNIDAAAVSAGIENEIRGIVLQRLNRKGVVVALSGGIDSSVVAALCLQALGTARVLGLMLPEADSSPDSLRLANLLAQSLGIRTHVEDIAGILTAAGCYQRRDEAIRKVIPQYTEGYQCKIVLPDQVNESAYPIFSVVVQSPQGERTKARLTLDSYLGVVAATNFKQRTRKMMEYYYADRFNYAVAGTPNRLEYDQGFFVKNGDGAADLKPIAHLYKTQVYQLASHLGIPEEIQKRPPTTDTYPLDQSQEEFYFPLPYDRMDLCLYAKNNDIQPEEVAPVVGLTAEQLARVYRVIDATRSATRYLHRPPVLCEQVPEVLDDVRG